MSSPALKLGFAKENPSTSVISKRGKVIATLIPASPEAALGEKTPKPDIMARLRQTWGDRVFSLEEVAAMREDELSGDLG